MDNLKHFYKTAQICENGHLRNTDMEYHAAKNEDCCSICGAKVISACPYCGSPLRGEYFAVKPCSSATVYDAFGEAHSARRVSGAKNIRISREVQVSAFCCKCGKPYPWTEATLKTAENIINMLDELTEDQKKQLIDFIPDIIIETPRSRFAALVYAKFLNGLQGLAIDCFKDWAKENVLPVLLVLMNMQKQ